MSHEHAVRAQKMAALREKDYRRVYVDFDGRIAVEVHEERSSPEQQELLRRVWGPEWPTVRSDRWHPPNRKVKPPEVIPDEKQFQFRSREY